MERLDLNGRSSGKMKVYCPLCRGQRKNKRDKSVSVNLDKGVAKCHYCGEVFKAPKASPQASPQASPRPSPKERGKGVTAGAIKPRPITPPTPSPSPLERVGVRLWAGLLGSAHIDWFARERGISRATLERMGVTSKEQWICFNYIENGAVVNTKYRDLEKNFRMTPGGKIVPYNIDGIRGTEECAVVEGEIDQLSFAEIGRTDVISVPTGANTNLSWMDEFIESHFGDKKLIYIAVDNDSKGLELRKALVARLGVERCRIVEYPQGCKDANEVLVKHGSEALKQCVRLAQEVPLEGVFTLKDVSADLRVLFEEGIRPGAETGWKNFDKLCTFELGRLCVVTGIPGSGKSEFVDELVMRLNIRHGWKAAFFSPENMPLTYHLRKLMEKATGQAFEVGEMTETAYSKAERYLQENFSFILPEEDFTVEHILDIAKGLVRKQGVKVLSVDPFNRFEHQVPTGHTETQYISAILDLFSNFALRNNCLVILVAHPRKMNKVPGTVREPVPGLYDINGSAAFYNKCDFGITVDRDDTAKMVRVLIQKVKFKHLGQRGEVTFEYNMKNGRYAPCEIDEQTGRPWKVQEDREEWGRIEKT